MAEPTSLTGLITKFKGNGRKFGYPTANLTTDTDLADGVYFGYADLKEFSSHPAVIFVGEPSTLGDTQRRVEAHLLDIPDVDYYGEKLVLRIEHYHRSNQTFADINMLLKAMTEDEKAARAWFAKN